MLSPADLLGIGIVAAGDPQAEVEPETPHVLNLLRPLESGSVEARALFELYAGEAAVLVKSPRCRQVDVGGSYRGAARRAGRLESRGGVCHQERLRRYC